MKKSRECYAIIVMSDDFDGSGRPMVMESYLDLSFREVMARAENIKETFGDAIVVELPVLMKSEVVRVAGSLDKVISVEGDS